jgi:hypothetical protein
MTAATTLLVVMPRRRQCALLWFIAVVVALALVSVPDRASAQTNMGTVTCKLTVDNIVEYAAVDGESLTMSSTCATMWETPCTLTFADNSLNGQVIAVEGSELLTNVAAGAFCASAGFAIVCKSTYTASAWNSVLSDSTWRSSSSMTRYSSQAWARANYDDSAWTSAVTSTSLFHCNSCGNNGAGQTWLKIWGCVRVRAHSCCGWQGDLGVPLQVLLVVFS